MKKPLRLLIWVLGGGVILIALFILAVNLYVQSDGVHRRIQKELSANTGLEGKMYRAGYSPWGGFQLHRVEYFLPKDKTNEPVFSAETVQIYSGWFSLLRGHLDLEKVVLVNPVLTLHENELGGLMGPVPAEAVPTLPVAPPIPPVAVQPTTPTPSASPAKTPEKTAPEKSAEETKERVVKKPATVKRVMLREGTVRILDNEGMEVLRIEHLHISADCEKNPPIYEGKMFFSRATIRNSTEITDFNSTLHFQNGIIDLPKIMANCAKGHISGGVTFDSRGAGSPYVLNFRLNKLLLPGLLAPDSDLASQLSGQLSGELQLQGKARQSRSMSGTGNFKILNGQFQQYPMLQVLGEILRSDELNHVELHQAAAQIEVQNSDLLLKSLELASQNLRLTSTGQMSSKRELDLNCLLYVNETTFKRLPTETRANFQAVPNSKDRLLSFKVDGTVEQPRTDFLKRVAGDRLERKVRGFFDSFSGKKAANPPDADVSISPTPSPAASATP